jgi:protein SCO1/2
MSNSLSRRDLFASLFLGSEPAPAAPRRVSPLAQAALGLAAGERASRRLPDCTVLNQHGERRRLVTDLISERRVIVGFIYTNCRGICPRTTEHMAAANRILRERGVEFQMLSISVDPAQDRPDDLAIYARANEVEGFDNWQFVVASAADTLAIRRSLNIVDPNPAKDAEVSNHSGLLILGNDRTDRWGAIPSGAEPIHIANTFERVTRDVSLREFAGFGRA